VTSLAGKVAVVTGASRGIGAAAATALAAAGAKVVRVARSLREGERNGFVDMPCDVADPQAVTRLGAAVVDRAGPPDLLVNNAGVFHRIPFEEASVEEFIRQVSVNLVGAFAVTLTFMPVMRAAGRGHVVSVGSVADATGFPQNSVYAATKYGLRGMHEALVAEYRGTGIRFSLVSPGPTDTSVWDSAAAGSQSGIPPRHQMLRPEDVAEAILFVASRPAHVQVDWLRLGPSLSPPRPGPDRGPSAA
jgi:NAD(P)-dependent dehydrogenase (short-subunit alcohol dehydrogenase family)